MGAGGTGGYYGGLLARAGFDVQFIARGEHLKAIQQKGLKVVSADGEFTVRVRATSEPTQVGPVDLILFCVKTYDTEYAAREILRILAKRSSLLTIQNGIDNYERISAIVGSEKVLPGAAFIVSEIEAPGTIHQSGGPRNIIFGEVKGGKTERANQIYETIKSAGITCELSDDIEKVLWEKFIWICGMAGVNCLTRLPFGPIMATEETRELLRQIMEEVREVARAIGVSVSSNYVDEMMDFAHRLEKDATASMFRDLAADRRLELEALHGTVVRLGKKNGIPTPVNRMVYATLKPHELGRPSPGHPPSPQW
jgi:2-dehydropantoate 2-reductase